MTGALRFGKQTLPGSVHPTSALEQWGTRMIAATTVRRVALAGLLSLTSGCDLLLDIPNLGDPDNLAVMRARRKAIVQAETRSPMPLN